MNSKTKTLALLTVIFTLLALFSSAAHAKSISTGILFLDSHEDLDDGFAGPISTGPLEDGKLYLITVEGTFSVWTVKPTTVICGGVPEPEPKYPTPNNNNGPVALDAAFTFAYPNYSNLCKIGAEPPLVSTHFQISVDSTDANPTWVSLKPIEESMTANHTYTYKVMATSDPNGLSFRIEDVPTSDNYGQLKITVEKYNHPPVVMPGGPYKGIEGSPVAFDGSGSYDPDGDPIASYAWTFGDGATGTGATPSHTYADNKLPGQVYEVCLTVTDSLGASNNSCTYADIKNVAPTVKTIFVDQNRVPVGTTIHANADFTDPGILDTHTAVWEWGDGLSSDGVVKEVNGSGNVTGSHAYAAVGRYTIKLRVTDKDGDSGWNQYQYVVVYDPKDFITGGGWFMSPANACPDFCQGATGKVNLGFVAKYSRNLGVPSGSTEFQFSSARLNFHSTSYERLDIIGAWAQYQGTGTINGSGVYGFILTAIDGKLNKGGGGDLIRMKIWDPATGTVIYDSQMGADDNVDPTTDLKGGSIVIHDK